MRYNVIVILSAVIQIRQFKSFLAVFLKQYQPKTEFLMPSV